MQKALFLFFFSLFSILHAVEALPKLVTEGESLRDFDENFYLDKRSPIRAVAISPDGRYIVSGSDDNSIKIWDKNQTRALKSMIGGQRGTWLMKDHEAQEKRFYRGDDGTLLLKPKREDFNTSSITSFTPALPKWYEEQNSLDAIELKPLNQNIYLTNAQQAKLLLDIENKVGKIPYLACRGESQHVVLHPQKVFILDEGESRKVALEVFAKVSRENPQFIDKEELKLSCTTPKGQEFNLSMFVSIAFSTLKVQSAKLSKDKKTFAVTLKNVGTEVLEEGSKIQLEAPFVAAEQKLKRLERNATQTVLFSVPMDENNETLEISDESAFKLSVSIANQKEFLKNPAGTKIAPAYVWHFDNEHVTIVLNRIAWYIYALWVMTGLVVLWLIWYLKRYRNTLVLQLQNDPKALLGLKPALWSEAREKLVKINELDSVLNTLGISHEQLDDAIAFETDSNQAQRFAKRIPKSSLVQEGRQQKLACHKTELSVDDFVLCFTDETATALEERFKEDGNRIFVLGSEKERDAIAKLARDKTNNLIAPTPEQWSAFLLGTKPQEVMMQILAECLEFSSISPYQTSKGLNKEVDFFGRIKIVRDIKMNSKRNYMIVGGRQLGKSSILKKLERAYAQSASVDCRFINLEGKKGNIVSAMVENFGLESRATLQDIHNYISQTERKMLLLIDEVDEFIEPEIKRDYETLKILKNLAEEGKASFVFAGYWTLYKYIVADYESPLYNFAELIVLEGLEQEACRELMIKPMQRIGLKHEDEGFLDEVIEACGRKANLIATICDEVLQQHKGKVILKEQLQKAMHSSAVRDKLLGWDSLETLDKIIIYLSVGKEQFEFDEVLEMLQKEQVSLQASVVKKSLERLVIAYILKREDEVFSYRVPLMKATILKTNEKGRKALLDELVGKL